MNTRIRKGELRDPHDWLDRFVVLFGQWSINFETRKSLRTLTDSQLQDIGIDRATAVREAEKPFWKL